MAFQPPGPYPVMPMQPVYGTPQRPPIPKAVLRSYYSILVGAVLSTASLAVTIAEFGTLRPELRADHPGLSAARADELLNITLGAVVVIGLIEILLWLWMAWKIKTGRHWARVLSSVFFGISVADRVLGNIASFSNFGADAQTNSVSTPHPLIALIIGWASVAVGLNAVVLFWQKGNAAFFRPQQFFSPGGYPYPYPFPPQGYPTAPYPQVPGQGGIAPQEGQPPQPPADPWSTPPK